MKYSLVLISLLTISSLNADGQCVPSGVMQAGVVQTNAPVACPPKVYPVVESSPQVLTTREPLRISVIGQGVAPVHTISPAQAYALAKRAATADAYRLIAERVKGVNVAGQDFIKNMMVRRSTVRTYVQAMVRNANIVETTFKDGLCEVEMEITLSHEDFAQ